MELHSKLFYSHKFNISTMSILLDERSALLAIFLIILLEIYSHIIYMTNSNLLYFYLCYEYHKSFGYFLLEYFVSIYFYLYRATCRPLQFAQFNALRNSWNILVCVYMKRTHEHNTNISYIIFYSIVRIQYILYVCVCMLSYYTLLIQCNIIINVLCSVYAYTHDCGVSFFHISRNAPNIIFDHITHLTHT